MDDIFTLGTWRGFDILKDDGLPVTVARSVNRMTQETTREAAFPFLCVTVAMMQQADWKAGFDAVTKVGATEMYRDVIINMWKALPWEKENYKSSFLPEENEY